MNVVNKRCKTITCLFIKVQSSVVCSPAGKYD